MAAFTAGDLVVYRVGTGAGALSSAATAVSIDEYSPTGALVQSIALPTADGAGQHALTASGSAGSEGLLTTSADGRYLLLTGYDAAPGVAGVASSTTVLRDVGRFAADGTLDTSTVLGGLGGNNIRSVASPDGAALYIGHGNQGVDYTTLGGSSVTSLSTGVTNARQVEVVGGQLFYDTGSAGGSGLGIGTIGTGLPTAAGQTATILAGTGTAPAGASPYGFFLADLSTSVTGYDTLYVADSAKGIEKFSLSGSTWSLTSTTAASGVTGLTGSVTGGVVTLYASSPTNIYALTDSVGYDTATTAAATSIATAATNEAFRGVAFAPAASTPADTTPPALASSTPAENATAVAAGANIVLTFSEAVKLGAGNITLVDTADASRSVTLAVTDASQVSVSGASVTLNPAADLHAGDTYHVSVDATAVTDLAGNRYMGGADVLDFTTALAPGSFPTGAQTATFAVTSAGTYQLAAGQIFTETGAATAVAATVADTALTTLDIEGALTGAPGQKGVVETVANGQLTVGSAGSIHASDADAFQFVQPSGGGGHANVTNLGSITTASTIGTPATSGGVTAHGYGLNFNAAAGGASATDHTSGGVITNGAGGATPNTTALIESDSDDAVRLGANQTLTNYGRIVGAGPVDDAASNNGQKTPAGSTTNRYDSSRGVEINGHSHDTVDNFGRIEGAQHGVDAGDTADSDITVVNEAGGVIIGHNGSGVGSDGASTNAANAADVTVTNSGAIYGEYHPTYDRSGAATTDGDGDGVDIDGAGTVTNNAGATIAGAGVGANGAPVLNGQGAGGFDSNGRANHSEGLSLGGGVVENKGLISGADYGITVNNDSHTDRSGVADTQITNEVGATIVGRNGYAIRLENKGADSLDTDSITNHGTITGGGTIPLATGAATLENGTADPNTAGMLNGVTYAAGMGDTNRFVSGDGAAIQMGEGNDTLVNDGTINGTATGHAISLEGGNDTLTLYAEGTVMGAIDGGAGTDTLNLAAHAATTANTLSGVTSFEALNVLEGVWTVGDAESFTTPTVISAGATLQLGAGATSGTLAGNIIDNGTLIINHSDAVILAGELLGSGTLSQIGSGVTTLDALHSFTGVTLAAGVLDIAARGGAGAGAITFGGTTAAPVALHVETAATSGGDLSNVLKGFAAGDTLDVAGLGPNATATLNATSHVLTVTDGTTTDTFHLDPSQAFANQVFHTAIDASGTGVAVTLAAAPAAPTVLFADDFTGFTAAGFAPGAAASTGQLDSNVFRVVGLSDIANPGYGFTGPMGGDFGRGVIAGSADPVTAGVYSPSANAALVLQPTGAELESNGFIEAHIVNGSGAAASAPTVDFDWTYRNSAPRADSLTLSYSTDDVNFTAVPAANFTTPGAADATTFSTQHEEVTLSGLNLPTGGDLYLRWTHTGSTGSGNRDEVGIDNVLVQAPSLTPASGSAFSVADATNVTSQPEGAAGVTTPFNFTVTRTGDLSMAQTVDYAVTGSGAHPADAMDFVGGMLPHGTLTFAANAASANLVVNVAGDAVAEPDEGFTVALSNPSAGAQVLGAPASATILNDDASFTTISAIQGAGQVSPLNGQTVTTSGVVTALDTTGSKGFYLQQPNGGDGDPATSDAVFVFTNAAPTVHVGDLVTVAGVVNEYRPTPAAGADSDTVALDANNLTLTEFDPTSVTVTGTGGHIDPVVIGAGGLAPPTGLIASTDPNAAYNPSLYARDFYESLEGQVVTVHNALAVDSTFSGETFIVPDNGADSPALNARGGVTVTDAPGAAPSAANYAPERIELFEDTGVLGGFTPAYNQGDHLGDVTGVVSYYNGEYELIPIAPPAVTTTQGPPADDVTTLRTDANHLTVGAYNVDNLGPVGSPGNADDTAAKYAALGHDIAYNLGAPAILGLEEIQDSDGEGTGSDLTATVTLKQVTSAISAAGGPAYSSVEIAPTVTNENGGAPNGNIRSAFIYDPSRVSLVAGSVRLIDDPSNPVMNANGTFNTGGTFYHSREPLAADFTFNGQTVTVIDVHQYSRLGSDELYGVDQPPTVGGDARRTAQADAVLHYVQGLEAANPNAQIVVEGDFNGLYFEKALTDLGQVNPATGQPTLINLVQTLSPAERYSYNFEGDSEQLDNYLVTPNLAGNALFDDVHVNTGQLNLAATSTDGSGAVSDHDPILGELTIGAPAVTSPPGGGGGSGGGGSTGGGSTGGGAPTGVTLTGGSAPGQLTGSTAGDSLTAGSAGDTLLGGDGADTLATGAGHDLLFGNMGDDHIVVGATSVGATVFGGQGNDVLDASASTHAQYLSGDLGNDVLVGGAAGADTLLGGSGADTLVAGAGRELLFGNADNDHIVIGANVGGQGVQAYGGQGDDVIDASRSNSANYISGDLGDDTIISGAGFETVLGGAGDDSIVGGASAGPGSMQILLGNQGNDHLSYAGAGGVELFGGQDSDTVSLTATQAGQVRYAFGNLGADTLTATGGTDSLYGGQGDDVVSAANDTVGHNYLSGDLGNDQVTASRGGADTLHGGQGADTITLTAHAAGAGDSVMVGTGESTAASATDESNLQHLLGFASGSDHILLAGHATLNVGAGGNLTTYLGGANASESNAFSAAYTYAYGDGNGSAAHIGATEYLAVQESYGGGIATYLFTADHHVIALVGTAAAGLQGGDVLAA